MRKISAKFVPRVLREDQKERLCHDSREIVELINSNPAVLDALVTCDESWIYCYDPVTKGQFPVEACWHSQTLEGHTEQIHPQTFDNPFFFFFFWQPWHDLYALGSHWTDSQQGILCWYFKGVQKEIPSERLALFKWGKWHFHQDNAPVHNSILVTDYMIKMGIKTVPCPLYSLGLAPCNFWLFPKLKEKLRGCRYETIEEIKEAVTKVVDRLTQKDFHGTFQKLLEQYNKCTATGGDYFEGD